MKELFGLIWKPAFAGSVVFAIGATIVPLGVSGPRSVQAQGVTEVCITLPGRDCQNRCITQECFDQDARENAERDRRARMTPEERDAEDKRIREEAENKRKAAAAEQEAAAAKAQQEREQREAAHKAAVDAQMDKFGLNERRRAEAERLEAMRVAAEKARPKPKAPPRQCTRRAFSQLMTNTASSQSVASQSLTTAIARKSGANIGGSESVISMTGGTPVCTQKTAFEPKLPPVGKCLACITEWQAAEFYGWVRGKGYPPPKVEWICQATVQVTAERCGTGTSKVSNQ